MQLQTKKKAKQGGCFMSKCDGLNHLRILSDKMSEKMSDKCNFTTP